MKSLQDFSGIKFNMNRELYSGVSRQAILRKIAAEPLLPENWNENIWFYENGRDFLLLRAENTQELLGIHSEISELYRGVKGGKEAAVLGKMLIGPSPLHSQWHEVQSVKIAPSLQNTGMGYALYIATMQTLKTPLHCDVTSYVRPAALRVWDGLIRRGLVKGTHRLPMVDNDLLWVAAEDCLEIDPAVGSTGQVVLILADEGAYEARLERAEQLEFGEINYCRLVMELTDEMIVNSPTWPRGWEGVLNKAYLYSGPKMNLDFVTIPKSKEEIPFVYEERIKEKEKIL